MRCRDCKFWQRNSVYSWPEPDKPGKNGQCTQLENSLEYWDDSEKAEEIIEDTKIGCTNLYTNENFGCIHFESK